MSGGNGEINFSLSFSDRSTGISTQTSTVNKALNQLKRREPNIPPIMAKSFEKILHKLLGLYFIWREGNQLFLDSIFLILFKDYATIKSF